MYVIVVGGGETGYFIVKALLDKGHEVAVIERDIISLNQLTNSLNVLAINGDGSDLGVLGLANPEKASVLVAVTEKDEDNLLICQLAIKRFGIDKVVAYVKNPADQSIFAQLGIERTVSAAASILDMIED